MCEMKHVGLKLITLELLLYNFPIFFYSLLLLDIFLIATKMEGNLVLLGIYNLQIFPITFIGNYVVLYFFYKFFHFTNKLEFVVIYFEYMVVVFFYFIILYLFGNNFSLSKLYNEVAGIINFYTISLVVVMLFCKEKIFSS